MIETLNATMSTALVAVVFLMASVTTAAAAASMIVAFARRK